MSELLRLQIPINTLAEKKIIEIDPEMWRGWRLFASTAHITDDEITHPLSLEEYIDRALPQDVDNRESRLFLLCEGINRLENDGSLAGLASDMGMSWHDAIREFRKTQMMVIDGMIENTKHRMGKSLGINVTDMSAVQVLAAALNHIK